MIAGSSITLPIGGGGAAGLPLLPTGPSARVDPVASLLFFPAPNAAPFFFAPASGGTPFFAPASREAAFFCSALGADPPALSPRGVRASLSSLAAAAAVDARARSALGADWACELGAMGVSLSTTSFIQLSSESSESVPSPSPPSSSNINRSITSPMLRRGCFLGGFGSTAGGAGASAAGSGASAQAESAPRLSALPPASFRDRTRTRFAD
jgi:hypothetical protein